MLRNLCASPRRFLLACMLCMLALSFALEAKIAWYGTGNGRGIDISSAKAQPADGPIVVEHGASTIHAVWHSVWFTLPAILVALAFPHLLTLDWLALERAGLRILSVVFFSPLPLRAPPAALPIYA